MMNTSFKHRYHKSLPSTGLSSISVSHDASLEMRHENKSNDASVVIGKNWKLSSPTPKDIQLSRTVDTAASQLQFSSVVEQADQEISEEKLAKYAQVRQYVLEELLQTERNYVQNLCIVLDHFKSPLLKAASADSTSSTPNDSFEDSTSMKSRFSFFSNVKTKKPCVILSMVDIKIIFSHVDELHAYSRDLCADMDRMVCSWPESEKIWHNSHDANSNLEPIGVSCLFDRDWSVYVKFVNNYSLARETIRRNETDNLPFREFVESCDRLPECKRLSVLDFLILPIQRVMRYALLLKDLLHNTPKCHPEYLNISRSLERMEKLAATVNQVKRQEEEITNMFHVMRVEDAPPTLLSAHRRVVFQSSVYSHDLKSVLKLFLFNDLIMLTTKRKHKDSMFRIAWLKNTMLEQVDESQFNMILPSNVDIGIFMTELAEANAAASSSITPRSSSKNSHYKPRSICEPIKIASHEAEIETEKSADKVLVNSRSSSLREQPAPIEHPEPASTIAKRSSSLGKAFLRSTNHIARESFLFDFEDKKCLKDFLETVRQLSKDGKMKFVSTIDYDS